MPLSIKDREADRLARTLAKETGETITEAVKGALRERLARTRAKQQGRRLADELDEIAKRCAALPILDPRSPDEILGYDEKGLPR
jgi:antitoxin VapB